MDGDEELRRLAASLDEDAVARTAQMADRSFVQAQMDGIRKDLYELQNKIWPGGLGGGAVDLAGAFAPVYAEGEYEEGAAKPVDKLVNCYYQVGGVTKSIADWTVPADATGIAALKVSASSAGDRELASAQVEIYESDEDLASAQADMNYVIVPLYRLSAGTIAADMRNMPTLPMVEAMP